MNFPARILKTTGAGAGALLVASATLAAQQAPQDTSKKVPLKQVAPVEARSSRGLSAISMLRALPNGSVYVNDNQRRQMLMLDPTALCITVVSVVRRDNTSPDFSVSKNCGLCRSTCAYTAWRRSVVTRSPIQLTM